MRAWVLNTDAELELDAGHRYTPSRAVREAVRRNEPAIRASLLGPGDHVLHEGERLPPALRGAPGRAWCPTPRALALLRAAGAEPEPAPPLDVLRRVNHRRFCAALGQTLPGAAWVEDAGALGDVVDQGHRWVLKRPLAVAGRGQRVVGPGPLTDADAAWVRASFRRDGLQVEPLVGIEVEWVIHGLVPAEGPERFGPPLVQETDPRGAWSATRPPRSGELGPEEARLLNDEARLVAGALREAGYFGPFGLDGFRWRSGTGVTHIQPRGEINARYTMGWRVAPAP